MSGGMVSMDGISHNKTIYNHIFLHKFNINNLIAI